MRSAGFTRGLVAAAASENSDGGWQSSLNLTTGSVDLYDPPSPFGQLNWIGAVTGSVQLNFEDVSGDEQSKQSGADSVGSTQGGVGLFSRGSLSLSMYMDFVVEEGEMLVVESERGGDRLTDAGGRGERRIVGSLSYVASSSKGSEAPGLRLEGEVTLNVPCVEEDGDDMIFGTVALHLDRERTGLTVEDGRAALSYPCAASGPATVEGTASRVVTVSSTTSSLTRKKGFGDEEKSTSGVILSNVTFTLTFAMLTYDEFVGVFSGVIDAVSVGSGLPSVPRAADTSDAAESLSTVAFGYGAAFGGTLGVGDITVNAPFRLSAGGGIDAATLTVSGTVRFSYPCTSGDVVEADDGEFSAAWPGKMNVSGLQASLTYFCGNTLDDDVKNASSSRQHPRLSVEVSTSEEVTVGAFRLKSLTVSLEVYEEHDVLGKDDSDSVSASAVAAADSEGRGSKKWAIAGFFFGSIEAHSTSGNSGGGRFNVGAVVRFAFDTRVDEGAWKIQSVVSYESPRLNATAQFDAEAECTEGGTSGSGAVSIALSPSPSPSRGEVGGVLKASATALRRCGSHAEKDEGVYEINATVAKATVILAGGEAIVELTDINMWLMSDGRASNTSSSFSDGAAATFEELYWIGYVSGDASLTLVDKKDDELPLLSKMSSLSAQLSFEILRGGDASYHALDVEGVLSYTGNGLQLLAKINFESPCTFRGELMELSFDSDSSGDTDTAATLLRLRVNNVTGLMSYSCSGGMLSIQASANDIRVGPHLVLTDASIRLVMNDTNDMETFDGEVNSGVNLVAMSDVTGPGLAEASSEGAGGGKSRSSFTFSCNPVSGFKFGPVIVQAGYALKSEVSSAADQLSAEGSIRFVYPCSTGQRAHGQALLTFIKTGTAEVSNLDVDVVYYCGKIASQQARWSIAGATVGGITVGDVTLNSLDLSASAFEINIGGGRRKIEFAGIISGALQMDVARSKSEGQTGAVAGFAFDTRDGSWAAAVSASFQSDAVNASLQLATSTGCTAKGTAGAGSVSVKFGKGAKHSFEGTASVLKRCGEYAEKDGVYSLRATVPRAVFEAGSVKSSSTTTGADVAVVTLFDVVVTLDSLSSSTTMKTSTAAAATTASSSSSSSAMENLDWRGTVSAGASLTFAGHAAGVGGSSVEQQQGSGLTASLTLVAELNFSIAGGGGSTEFETLRLHGDLAFTNEVLSLAGSMNVAVPCSPGSPMISGHVVTNLRTDAVTLVKSQTDPRGWQGCLSSHTRTRSTRRNA